MAPREDLVSSAVTFLQDPSVANAPVEKRIEFLKSKNLTQEEIELSLARAGNDSSLVAPPPNSQFYPPPQQQWRGPPSQAYPYPYNPYGEWQTPPPPEPPRRDWRDYFIMATVVGGASYGLYVLAQRYIKPLIAPPTPPQLEQDKAAIDEQFNKAFALIDTLSSDTTALKEAEEARTQRLDSAIGDIESIVADLKAANMRREDDARRMESEVKSMKDSLPRSIDSVKDASERQLKELSTELASLKLLMGNRIGSSSNFATAGQAIPRTQPGTLPSASTNTTTAATPSTEPAPGASPIARQPSSYGNTQQSPYPAGTSVPVSAPATRPASAAPFAGSANKAAIPAWQMAAQNKAKDFNATSSTNGASAPQQQDGADAVAALSAS
jgi:peroxin-14